MKTTQIRHWIFPAAGVLALFLGAGMAQAATITVVNLDGAGEGFNDTTAVPAVAGNPATTLGGQRLNAAQAAADAWGAVLTSPVEIRVGMNFDPLDCNAGSALLGQAGPESINRDFPGAPMAATWYPIALANSLEGIDAVPGVDDIGARFNSAIDFNNACLAGTDWWYGIGSPAVPGTIDFFRVLLHEMGHGLGFLTLVDTSGSPPTPPSGNEFLGFQDIYEVFLEDHSLGQTWPNLSSAQRVTSSTDASDLHWTGPNAVANSGVLSSGVHASGHVQMFAPSPVQPGSSVSHWDTAVAPNELMEPFATPDALDLETYQLFRDLGWTISGSVTGGGPPVAGPNPPNVYCSTPGVAIPDNDPGGVVDVLSITDIAPLADVSVQIEATHTWVGDLSVSVQRNGGTQVVLLDRPGVPATAGGCQENNVDATLWDGAASAVEDECPVADPTLSGQLIPNGFLSDFDGENLIGNWVLTVSDSELFDTGTLDKWCILPISHGECDGNDVLLSGRLVPNAETLVCNAGFFANDTSTVEPGGELQVHFSGHAGFDTLQVMGGGVLGVNAEASAP